MDSNFSVSHFFIRRKKVTVVSFIVVAVVVVVTFTRQGSEKFAGFKTKSIKHLAPLTHEVGVRWIRANGGDSTYETLPTKYPLGVLTELNRVKPRFMQHGSAFGRGIQVVICCFLGGEKLKVYSRCPSWNFTDHISLPVLTVHIALLGKAALRKLK